MKILSLDVSGNYSSISMLNDDEVNTFTQTHDRKDRPDWDKLFSSISFDSSKDFDSLDGMAFARGPGSYTALRITSSFLKAIAEVKKLPLIAISNLESIAHEASNWIDKIETKIYVAIEADTNESYFCSYHKNDHQLNPISAEGLLQMEELSDLLNKDDCYFAGTGWPKAAENNPQFLSQALGSAEPIATIAKTRLETGEIFLPENANPVYLKTPDYKKS
ncbi:tRNA (adenosine(37)-N6)-threonylcarbamoyltransferase complex dimerization subunit type 1 TsaB [Pseudomonadota bacterium]|nr:tRNA (adenosine(37)-N6)-threonylcarbamoyltransferase complex dimerization subunit type 1 TsaB [Pseudomonadota bacterium]